MGSNGSEFAFVGGLRQDYCITHDHRVFAGVMGGNALYSAVGARVWAESIAIVSRVGSNYPEEWLRELRRRGFDLSGVHVLPETHDTRTFYAYLTAEDRVDTNPAAHFLRVGQPLPKDLIGYQHSTLGQDSRRAPAPLAVRPEDLPEWIGSAKGVHFAPADYLTHIAVPSFLREKGVPCITLDPSVVYMDPSYRSEVPHVVHGLDAFLPSEMEAEAYFRPAKPRPEEMAESFLGMGCRIAVIKRGPRGQLVADQVSGRRWAVTAYPAKVRDVTGAGDAYCGGFLVGLARTGDPLEAALMGSVSASLVVEGSGALFCLDVLPGLAEARLDSLRRTHGKL